MRLSFANGEHADVIVDGGVTGIGAAQGNTIKLDAGGVRPWHARLIVDQRGMILEVLDPGARTHVNARPVVEKALLRLGDIINFEDVSVQIKPDDDGIIDTRVPAEAPPGSATEVSRVVLRGLSGAHFGKTIAVGERLLVGSGSGGLDIDEPGMNARHASIDATDDAIHLRDLGSENGTEVNGVKVRNAVLHPGDQISFGRNRFVLEAPGYAARGQRMPTPAQLSPAITQTLDAIGAIEPPPVPARDDGSSSVWWLIAAAAMIGVGIAGLLWFGNY